MAEQRTRSRILTWMLVGVVALAGAAPAFADELPPEQGAAGWKGDAAWIFAGRALDVGATEWALSRNPTLVEGNPLLRSRRMRIGLNAALAVGGVVACAELRKLGHPGTAKWLSRAIFIVGAGFAANAVVRGASGGTH
jgi:hypothetical protein